MKSQTKVTGMILAGGLGRRMNHLDKGLIEYKGRPLISYAIEALVGATGHIIINANRNNELYRQFGFEVIPDQTGNFDGPLAGILSLMNHADADADVLLVVPCDSPLIKTEHLMNLLSIQAGSGAEVAVGFDGVRIHPVFLAIKMEPSLINNLTEFLSSGQRKIEHWLQQVNCVPADFSNTPEIFTNINTLDQLSVLEKKEG
ncbi:MAG: molybdenum cofactor guanylyltransferase MobA [Gammaproteobacteria bacterium]